MHRHAPMRQRLAHGMFQLHVRQQARVHLRLVETVGTAPPLLDTVHRRVRLLDQVIKCVAILREQGHADAALDGQPHAIERKGALHVIDHALRNAFGHGGVTAIQVDDEFIPAQA